MFGAGWEDDDFIDSWLVHGGRGRGLTVAGQPARQVLAARLAIRRRARWAAAAFGVPAVVAMGLSAWVSWSDDSGDASGAGVWWWMVSLALFAAAPLARADAIRRGERELARSLPRRVTTVARESVRRKVGVLRVANLGLAVGLNMVLFAAMLLEGARLALVMSYGCTLALVLGCVFVTLRELVRKPALAVDVESLVVDRRLRAWDWYLAILPLGLLLAGVSVPVGLLAGFDAPISGQYPLWIWGPWLLVAVEAMAEWADRRAARPPGPLAHARPESVR